MDHAHADAQRRLAFNLQAQRRRIEEMLAMKFHRVREKRRSILPSRKNEDDFMIRRFDPQWCGLRSLGRNWSDVHHNRNAGKQSRQSKHPWHLQKGDGKTMK